MLSTDVENFMNKALRILKLYMILFENKWVNAFDELLNCDYNEDKKKKMSIFVVIKYRIAIFTVWFVRFN